MTYFETPDHKEAYVRGMSLDAFYREQEALEQEAEYLWDEGQPHLDPEDRDLIPEGMVSLVSEQDRADLDALRDWEAFGGFHNP